MLKSMAIEDEIERDIAKAAPREGPSWRASDFGPLTHAILDARAAHSASSRQAQHVSDRAPPRKPGFTDIEASSSQSVQASRRAGPSGGAGPSRRSQSVQGRGSSEPDDVRQRTNPRPVGEGRQREVSSQEPRRQGAESRRAPAAIQNPEVRRSRSPRPTDHADLGAEKGQGGGRSHMLQPGPIPSRPGQSGSPASRAEKGQGGGRSHILQPGPIPSKPRQSGPPPPGAEEPYRGD